VVELASRARGAESALQRLAWRDPCVAKIINLVAGESGVAPADLLRRNRCRAEIAAARQLAMYLVNVKLDYSMTQVGELFGRDRTTVAHACMSIEDRRDDGPFDEDVSRLEAEIEVLMSGAGLSSEVRHAAG
jgi:chromosomal replication initiation ATPase DnaA